MLSPRLAASKGKKQPSVNKIELISPPLSLPSSRKCSFEIGGKIKTITLSASVGKNDDKSLVSWAVYKGETQEDRLRSYLEHGSELRIKLEDLSEGKATVYGYGKSPSGDTTKIIINRRQNKLKGISMNPPGGEIPKKTPVVLSPRYTFPDSEQPLAGLGSWLTKTKWKIKDDKGNILYTFSYGFTPVRTSGIIITASLGSSLTATFMNSETYQIELEDSTQSQIGIESDKKTCTIQVKNRSASTIIKKSTQKIRKGELIHLVSSGIKFDYGIAGLGDRAFWHVQKDTGKIINLGLRLEIKMKVFQLIEEFSKQQVPVDNPYGFYKFQIDGEEKDIITIGGRSDTSVVEVAKNRMESINGPDKLSVGSTAVYKTQTLMPLIAGENVSWKKSSVSVSTVRIEPSSDRQQATVQFKQPGKVHLSASLEGTEVSSKPVEKPVEAVYLTLERVLWCYANAKRRAETGWEEENYLHVSLEGITSIPVKLRVWVQHPDFGREETLSYDNCQLKEIDTVLDSKGSCQVSFIADNEIKDKIQKIYPQKDTQSRLFFTLEFIAGELLDLSRADLVHKENSESVPFVEKQGKNQYLVLDSNEDLKLSAMPRITAINFSNESGNDIQVGVTQYGIKHTLWVNTVGMPKEKLVVIVYKQLLKDDMKETYNDKEKAFAVTSQEKKYEAQEVGSDGLLSLDFTPEKKDADGDPQLFYAAVYTEQKDEKGEITLVEKGSQLKSLDSLPFDKELNKDCSQAGIVMPSLEEGQSPTAEQLKEIVSRFFHFYNPLYVSETGTIEDQQVISPVLVERGENYQSVCPRCGAPVTAGELKQNIFRSF
jgi:hypothetical protein